MEISEEKFKELNDIAVKHKELTEKHDELVKSHEEQIIKCYWPTSTTKTRRTTKRFR